MYVLDPDTFHYVLMPEPPPRIMTAADLGIDVVEYPPEYFWIEAEQVPTVISGGPDLEGVGGYW